MGEVKCLDSMWFQMFACWPSFPHTLQMVAGRPAESELTLLFSIIDLISWSTKVTWFTCSIWFTGSTIDLISWPFPCKSSAISTWSLRLSVPSFLKTWIFGSLKLAFAATGWFSLILVFLLVFCFFLFLCCWDSSLCAFSSFPESPFSSSSPAKARKQSKCPGKHLLRQSRESPQRPKGLRTCTLSWRSKGAGIACSSSEVAQRKGLKMPRQLCASPPADHHYWLGWHQQSLCHASNPQKTSWCFAQNRSISDKVSPQKCSSLNWNFTATLNLNLLHISVRILNCFITESCWTVHNLLKWSPAFSEQFPSPSSFGVEGCIFRFFSRNGRGAAFRSV